MINALPPTDPPVLFSTLTTLDRVFDAPGAWIDPSGVLWRSDPRNAFGRERLLPLRAVTIAALVKWGIVEWDCATKSWRGCK
jgi:hypothetical protein